MSTSLCRGSGSDLPTSLSFDSEHLYHEHLYHGDRPSLLVYLGAADHDEGVRIAAVLDTGSSQRVFGRTLGERAGLSFDDDGWHEMERMTTGGGHIFGWWRDVHLRIEVLDLRLYPRAFVTTAEGAADARPSILGLSGVFDRVQLGLIHAEGRLLLSRDPSYEQEPRSGGATAV